MIIQSGYGVLHNNMYGKAATPQRGNDVTGSQLTDPAKTAARVMLSNAGQALAASESSEKEAQGTLVASQTDAQYKNTGSMPMMSLNYFSFGDETSLGSPSGDTRLEYNAYRPDGMEIDGSGVPFIIKSTGEKLTGATQEKYRTLLLNATKDRIGIYKDGKSRNLSDDQILENLQTYDRNLPDSYRALVGNSDMVDPLTRYNMPTHDEVMQA